MTFTGASVFVTGGSTDSGSFEDYATIKYSGTGVPLWTNRYTSPLGISEDGATAVAVVLYAYADRTAFSHRSMVQTGDMPTDS